MKLLFIGGTGVISSEITMLSLKKGHEVYLLNRKSGQEYTALGAKHIKADIRDPEGVKAAINGMEFDVVADFICYTKSQAEKDYELFNGRCGQFMFISSASVYYKPAGGYLITESTPIKNPYWQYSRDKIECEDYFFKKYRENDFPVTIIRPSHTYGQGKLPTALSGAKSSWTHLEIMRRGDPVIVHGDGTSLWTLTHSADFAVGFCGLMGRNMAVGHPFHITSDEYLSWDGIMNIIGKALGVSPNIVHITSDDIIKHYPEYEGTLLGDKSNSAIFDNSKIKRFVPEFNAVIPFEEGARQVIGYMNERPELQIVDEDYMQKMKGLARSVREGIA